MFDYLLRPRAWKQSGDYSGRKGRDGQKKNIGKANKKRKRKHKKTKDEVNEEGRKKGGTLAPCRVLKLSLSSPNAIKKDHQIEKILPLTSITVIGKRETRCVATDDDRQFNVRRDASSRWLRLSNCQQ